MIPYGFTRVSRVTASCDVAYRPACQSVQCFRRSVGRSRVRREEKAGGDERQQARITFILLLLASYLFLWGFPTLDRAARSSRTRGARTRRTSSDSRTRARAAAAAAAAAAAMVALRPSLVSRLAPARDTPLGRGVREKPRARLMALRGCHGYGEPHGTDATAAPSGKPIYSGKTL